MPDIKKTWLSIHDWYAKNGNPIAMAPSASKQDIARLEAKLQVTLDADFKQSYLLHNGSSGTGLFPYGPYLLSIAEIIDQHGIWMKLTGDGALPDATPAAVKGVKRLWWNEKWIPITASGGGDHDCIDMAPGIGGTIGQVIEFSHETGPRKVVAKSYGAWLSGFAADLRKGKYRYDEDSWTLLPVEEDD